MPLSCFKNSLANLCKKSKFTFSETNRLVCPLQHSLIQIIDRYLNTEPTNNTYSRYYPTDLMKNNTNDYMTIPKRRDWLYWRHQECIVHKKNASKFIIYFVELKFKCGQNKKSKFDVFLKFITKCNTGSYLCTNKLIKEY